MSQVIQKLQEGGFFKYPSGQIETERLIKALSLNLDKYLSNQDWSRKRKERFLNSVNKFITGIKNGNIKEMTEIGRFYDSRGIGEGGVSDDTGRRFKEDKEAATFVKWVLNAQDPYKKPEEKPKDSFNIDKLFAKQFNKLLFNTDSDKLNYNNLSIRSEDPSLKHQFLPTILNALRNINTDDWGVFGTRENFINKINDIERKEKDFKNKHNGKISDKEIRALLSGIGLDTDFLNHFHPPYPTKQPSQTRSQIQSQPQTQNQSQNQTQSQNQDYYSNLLLNPNILNWWNSNYNQETFLPDVTAQSRYVDNQLSYMQNPNYISNFLKRLGNIPYANYNTVAEQEYQMPFFDNGEWKNNQQNTYSQLASNVLNYLISNGDTTYLTKIDDEGKYAIMPTLQTHNGGTGLITLYNPNTRQIYQVPAGLMLNDSQIGPKIRQSITPQQSNTRINWKKQGGIIKFQNSGKFDFNTFTDFNKIIWDFDKRLKQSLNEDNSITYSPRISETTDNTAPGNKLYDIEPGGKEVEDQNWYQNWLTSVQQNPTLQENFANYYIQHNPVNGQKYKDRWFQNGTFNSSAFITDFVGTNGKNGIATDKANGIGHDFYKGTLYRKKGTNEFISPDEIKKYTHQETSEQVNPFLQIIDVYNDDPEEKPKKQTEGQVDEKEGLTDEKENDENFVTAGLYKNKSNLPKNQWYKWLFPIASSTARFLETQNTNKKMLEEAFKSRPLYFDPKQFNRTIYGDYGALSQAHDNAAQINTKTSVPISSDAGLQAARQLEGEKLANQERWKGFLANAQAIKQSTEQSLAQDKQNMEWRIDNSNENRRQQYIDKQLKINAKQGYLSRSSNNFNTFLLELQNNMQNWFNTRSGIEQSAVNKYIENNFENNPELNQLKTELAEWVRNNPGKDYTTSDIYKQIVEKSRQINVEASKYYLDALSRIYGVPYSKNLLKEDIFPDKVKQEKSGGKLEERSKLKIAKMKNHLDQQKLFYKSISDSIKDNSKMINSLSNTMQKLIMRAVK